MTNARVVTFDIANASFHFYTQDMWEVQIAEWRDDLETNGCEDVADMDEDAVVECIWGDEMFVDYIPEDVK